MRFLVYLRAVFDTVDRRILIKAMKKRGIRKGIVGRCIEILREMKCRMRVQGRLGKEFWTGREVRQECPLSPGLI